VKKSISAAAAALFIVALSVSLHGYGNNSKLSSPDSLQIAYQDSSVTLQWDSVPGAEKYYIYGKSIPDSIDTIIDSTTVTNWIGIYNQDKYFFSVTAKSDEETPGSMVLVQGGTFGMGDRHGDYIVFDCVEEIPVHNVTVDNFLISKYEVTQAEWSQYMTGTFEEWSGLGPNYPAYNLNWYQTLVYCNKRSTAEGLTPCYTLFDTTDPNGWGSIPETQNSVWDAVVCNWLADGYRLPSEAEWEYAARGGFHHTDNFRYSGCNEESQVPLYAIMIDYEVGSAMPVGLRLPNQLGIYDMSGNICEIVWDWHDYPDYTYYDECYSAGTVQNPRGPVSGLRKVHKGGHWYGATDGWYIRVAQRWSTVTYSSSYAGGFRVARTP